MSTYRTELYRSRDPRFVQSRISEEGIGILGTTTDGPVIAVVGSRDFYDYPLLKETLDTLLTRSATLISGGASGADALAEKYAREHGRTIEVIAPDWKTHGPSAGFRRNREIVEKATRVIAFWDGSSRGTAHVIDLARAEGKSVHIVRFSK